MSDRSPSEIVFLFGAGASIEAGVPDSFKFVEDFRWSIDEEKESAALDSILETLSKWKKKTNGDGRVDIELLLEALLKLETRDEEPLLEFVKGGRFLLKDSLPDSSIAERLRDFIKSKAIVRAQDRINYLKPLRGFIEERKPLDIITVNYDTCVEQFSAVHNLIYQDGFDVNWNPECFEKGNIDVRLYKLHGSVIWYRSDRGGYIKLPVMTDHARIELITGEKAESMMLYPMQKYDYVDPLLELVVRARNLMQNRHCKFLIVVGYSFRDEYILRMLLDAAGKNSDLTVILIDPDACRINEEKLRYLDSSFEVPSPLNNRVVCLPYRFEKLFPRLKDEYLRSLRMGLTMVSDCTSRELRGVEVDWFGCLEPLANAEHIAKLQWLLDTKIDRHELERRWQLYVEVLLKMSVNLAASFRYEECDRYLHGLKSYLHRILRDGIQAQIAKAQDNVIIDFAVNMPSTGPGAHPEQMRDLKPFMLKLQQHLVSRWNMAAGDSFTAKFSFVDNLLEYLNGFEGERMTFEHYTAMRKKFIADQASLRASMLAWLKRDAAELINPFAEQMLAIEKKAIAELFEPSVVQVTSARKAARALDSQNR